MTLIVSEQLTALALLFDFLCGISCGVFGGAVVGSRRGILLWPATDGLLSGGARVIFDTWTRGYHVDPRNFCPGGNQSAGRPGGDDGSVPGGKGANR